MGEKGKIRLLRLACSFGNRSDDANLISIFKKIDWSICLLQPIKLLEVV